MAAAAAEIEDARVAAPAGQRGQRFEVATLRMHGAGQIGVRPRPELLADQGFMILGVSTSCASGSLIACEAINSVDGHRFKMASLYWYKYHHASRTASASNTRIRRIRPRPTGEARPAASGLPAGRRRRTPGLRREEVAQLCGLSVTWYTWIEQGREISLSPAALARLAAALRLDRAERAYLFELAGKRDPEEGVVRGDELPRRSCSLRQGDHGSGLCARPDLDGERLECRGPNASLSAG